MKKIGYVYEAIAVFIFIMGIRNWSQGEMEKAYISLIVATYFMAKAGLYTLRGRE